MLRGGMWRDGHCKGRRCWTRTGESLFSHGARLWPPGSGGTEQDCSSCTVLGVLRAWRTSNHITTQNDDHYSSESCKFPKFECALVIATGITDMKFKLWRCSPCTCPYFLFFFFNKSLGHKCTSMVSLFPFIQLLIFEAFRVLFQSRSKWVYFAVCFSDPANAGFVI